MDSEAPCPEHLNSEKKILGSIKICMTGFYGNNYFGEKCTLPWKIEKGEIRWKRLQFLKYSEVFKAVL